MKLTIANLLLLLIPFIGFSQKMFVNKYKDKLEKGSKLMYSGYNYTLEKAKDKSLIYKKYYPGTRQITNLITYRSNKDRTLHGPYKEWYDDGTLWKSGIYKNGKRLGRWSNSDHSTIMEGEYEDDVKTGQWTTKDMKGNLLSKYNYLDGELEGSYLTYDSTGKVIKEILYKAGEVVDTLKDESGEVFEVVEVFPSFPGCESIEVKDPTYKKCAERKLLEYIYSNVSYPKIARKYSVEGMALFSFVVNKEGEVEDLFVLRGLCKEIEANCVSLIENMPNWHPGLQNGEPVKVKFNLPVRFKLD